MINISYTLEFRRFSFLSPFWRVAFWSVAVLDCRRFGFVAVSVVAVFKTATRQNGDKSIQNGDTSKRRHACVLDKLDCRRFGVSPFWMCRLFSLSPFWRVAVLVVAVL